MRYQNIIVDTVNFAYRTFRTKTEVPKKVGKHEVYKESVKAFIKRLEEIELKYLVEGGQIYLLIDNYYSRADLQSVFSYIDRKELDEAYKATRKKENREFYNSINLVRYYYLHAPERFHTIRIENLEADDLVAPVLENYCAGQTSLLVTTDFDWTRYLSDKIHWIPDFTKEPQTKDELSTKMGFGISETSVILYKALFGDASDNIKGVSRETKEHKAEFLEVLPSIRYPEDILTKSRGLPAGGKGLLYDLSKNEAAFIINLSLISAIPVNKRHIDAVLTTGRDVPDMRKTIREAIGFDGVAKFRFGGIHRPRIEEVEEPTTFED